MRQKFVDEILNKVEDDYDSISVEFDSTRNHAWYEFEIYKELLSKGDKILDLGCGNGRLYDYLADNDIDYVGVDVSAELLNKARLKNRKSKNGRQCTFKKGSFLDLPYVRPVFNKIYCVASFHHIPGRKYRLQALENMKKILKDDGTLVISVWNLWQKRYRKYIFESLFRLNKYDFGDTFIPWGKTGVNRYYHAFSLFEMRTLLRESGFYIVDEIMVKKGSVTDNAFEAENFIFIAKPLMNE
jgi:ubiquinone/menaquinone biosynthesis C-methylase UbiE